MPPPSVINGFDPRFFRPCIFPTLGRLGYDVRPTINNGLPSGHPLATDLVMSLTVFAPDGTRLGTTGALQRLAPGEIAKLDFGELIARDEVRAAVGSEASQEDCLAVIHLVPADLDGVESADISPKSMMAHVLASDDFIEYYQRDGEVVTGVAYQTGPKNDARLSSTMTTVTQAPKVIVSEPVDTLFCLMNVSTRLDYADPVEMRFWILRPDGTGVVQSSIEVPAWSFRLLSTKSVLEEAGELERFQEEQGGLGMFIGYAENGTLIPLSLTRNGVSGAIACDHTLPPVFYVPTWGGPARLAANERLAKELFPVPVAAS